MINKFVNQTLCIYAGHRLLPDTIGRTASALIAWCRQHNVQNSWVIWRVKQSFWASPQLFTSPFKVNAFFSRESSNQLGLKIRDPVPLKFKHVANIETCTVLCYAWLFLVVAYIRNCMLNLSVLAYNKLPFFR